MIQILYAVSGLRIPRNSTTAFVHALLIIPHPAPLLTWKGLADYYYHALVAVTLRHYWVMSVNPGQFRESVTIDKPIPRM